MRFIDDMFPLIVVLNDPLFGERQMREMVQGFEKYFQQEERYAVAVVSPGDSIGIDAKGRKLIGDWVNEPRVCALSAKLCVGASVVVPSAVSRGSLTALLWFWTPPTPLRATSTVEAAIDFSLERLRVSNVRLPRPRDVVRGEVLRRIRNLGSFAPSLQIP